jgi:hypothetical protein
MGDYTKLIVNCNVMSSKSVEDYKEQFLKQVYICSSAYHCGGETLHIENEWGALAITFVTQLKYSRGLDEFIEWLRPQVVDGFGRKNWFALSCTEYDDKPVLYCKGSGEE